MIHSQLEMVNISIQHAVSLQIKGYVIKKNEINWFS